MTTKSSQVEVLPMDHDKRWPKTKEQPCQFCGKTLRLTRQGVAPVYSPGFKVPNRGTGYGYSAKPHDCPERDRIRGNLGKLTDAFTSALTGKKR